MAVKQHQRVQDETCPYTEDDFRRMEEHLRQLAIVAKSIDRCERCKIPIAEAKADLEGQVAFFTAILQEYRGPQAPIGG